MDFWVGASKKDITPSLGTLLFGYPSTRPADKVHDNLYVGAVAIKQNEKIIIFLGIDTSVVAVEVASSIKEKITAELDVKAENIFCCGTHTHSAPCPSTYAGWGEANTEYIDGILIRQSVEAAKEAVLNMKSAVMGISKVDCYAGVNRRQRIDGNVVLGINPDGPFDPTMTAMLFKTVEGENIATIIHYACHATVCGGNTPNGINLSITRDWPSFMYDAIEEFTNAPCLYLNGAEGDIGPRLSNGKTTADESYLEEIGSIAARDAVEALQAIKDFKVPQLKTHSESIILPMTTPPSYEEICKEIEEIGTPDPENESGNVLRLAKLNDMKAVYDKGEAFDTCMELSQTVVAFDDMAIVPFPFEAFCNIALDLREKSPFNETLLLGVCNGNEAYLPTEDELPFGGYEVDSFYARQIPGFVDSLDKEIVKENVRLLNKLHKI